MEEPEVWRRKSDRRSGLLLLGPGCRGGRGERERARERESESESESERERERPG